MATLRDIRSRISGVKSTSKITQAMKMVAAAKLRRAQDAIIAARPYAKAMQGMLHNLSTANDTLTSPLLKVRAVDSILLIVVSSDRGLCGAFNTNLFRAAANRITHEYGEFQKNGSLKVITAGKRSTDFFTKRGYNVIESHPGIFQHLDFVTARTIATRVTHGFLAGEFDRVEIIYNEFKTVAQSHVAIEQLLPVATEAGTEKKEANPVDYIFEPSAHDIIDVLLPKHLNMMVWKSLLESNAAEQAARMTAMEAATTNARDLIRSLQLVYNKARQAAITKEILEIVGGAEALAKG